MLLLESELGNIQIGDRAEVKISMNDYKSIKGRVTELSPVSDNYTKEDEMQGVETKFRVKLNLFPDENLNLLPQMKGQALLFAGKVNGFSLILKSVREIIRPDLFM